MNKTWLVELRDSDGTAKRELRTCSDGDKNDCDVLYSVLNVGSLGLAT